MAYHDWEEFEHNGRTFARRTEHDDSHGHPWEECCGHGVVSGWEHRDKAPGELILATDWRSAKLFYDFAATVRIARRDGWDTPPYRTGTPRQRAARAARADYEFLRRYCDGQWSYVGVIVAPVCECCGEVKEDDAQSLWGVESDSDDYLREVSEELAEELAPKSWRRIR